MRATSHRFLRRLSGLVAAAVLAGPAVALASDNVSPVPDPAGDFRPGTRGYIKVTPEQAGGGVFSRILFINRCLGDCIISPGFEDSGSNHSSIIGGTRTLTEYEGSEAQWDEIMACARRVFAPFDVEVTDVDPGNVAHMESIVAGTSGQFGGLGNNTLGVAPYSCGYIGESMSFTFANAFDTFYAASAIPREICATLAQEAAHSWGLDHEMLSSDPMTYLNYNGERSFKDQAVRCGEYDARDCDCTGPTQNSYQEILSTFGSAEPTPPVVTIVRPSLGANVSPGFPVEVQVEDFNGVEHIELWVNGEYGSEIAFPPYVLNAPDDLSEGTIHVEVKAYDNQGTEGTATVDVIIGEPCETPADCQDIGEAYTCVGGRCVPGDGAPGGLGTECDGSPDCFSGLCLSDGEQQLCGERCELGAGQCPSGYGCLDVGQEYGSCWPGVDEGGGCCSSSQGPAAPIVLSLGVLGALATSRTRRRRRAAR